VRRLSAKLAATTAAEVSEYDAADIVQRALRFSGDVIQPGADATASALSIVDARRRSTLAVDSAAAFVAEALAGEGFRTRLDVARASEAERDAAVQAARAAGGRLVLLIDRPDVDADQRALVEIAARHDPHAVVVNVGLAAQAPLPLPVVEVAAASRVGAEAARAALLVR